MTEPTNLTIKDLEAYIMALARLKANGQPYSIDFTTAEVKINGETDGTVYQIRIPERVLNSITLEEK